MKHDPNVTPEIYKLLDQAGLDGATLYNSKKSMSKIINEIRTRLAENLTAYILKRDQDIYNAGARSKDDE